MNGIALTQEQREFAADHHNLIYAFLNKKHLRDDEFYDIVVFGFLRAVQDYLNEPKLVKYSFTTIAWRKMNDCVAKHYKSQSRQKNYGYTVSLDDFLYEGEPFSLEAVISAPDPLMMQLETELLLHDLAARVSKRQMTVIRLKANGYGDREIAKNQKTTVQNIRDLLEGVRGILLEM